MPVHSNYPRNYAQDDQDATHDNNISSIPVILMYLVKWSAGFLMPNKWFGKVRRILNQANYLFIWLDIT